MMLWDTVKNTWTLRNYYIRTFDGDNENLVSGQQLDTLFRLVPKDLNVKVVAVEGMSKKELDAHIEDQRLSGTSAIVLSEIEKYSRFANPFSTFILTLIGFALSVRKVRGGLGINIGIGLLLSFTYILFMRFSTVFAISGTFSAIFSVWIPNILYTIIAIGIYITTPK